jgi:hypothetical protein
VGTTQPNFRYILKKAPLVVFQYGRKWIAGEGVVDLREKTVTFHVDDDRMLLLMFSNVGQFNWGPPDEKKPKNCLTCLLGLCGDEPKENTCDCCRYDHIQ